MKKRSRILLVYTGGTIGMVRQSQEEAYVPINFKEIESEFPELKRLPCEIEVISFDTPMDSSNMKPLKWQEIAGIITNHYDAYDGFVILHGSDTMAYTGSALSFMLENLNKPVILTGAQLPVNEIRTDARENLLTAIQIAAHPEKPIREVCIYFEYKLYRANRCKKVNADTFHAFHSPNFPILAEAGVHIKFHKPTPAFLPKGPLRLQSNLEPSLAVVKFFPGMPWETLKMLMKNSSIKGVVLESYGSGNLPTEEELIEIVRSGIQRGKIVLNITQCTGGAVEMGRYSTSEKLKEVGVISGKDLTFEAAITKMMYLMGKFDDNDRIKYYLTRNLCGEMTAESAQIK